MCLVDAACLERACLVRDGDEASPLVRLRGRLDRGVRVPFRPTYCGL